MKLSVELEPALYPFKLLDAERAWDGEDWAWKFLRLNPRYRHDVMLAAKAERFGTACRRPSVEHFLRTREGEQIGREALLAEDSRLFMGECVLDSGSAWPAYRSETLGEHLQREKALSLSSVRFREFDAARDYGISQWIDPKHATLPPARRQLSWFHWMTEPVWESAHENFIPTEVVVAEAASGTRMIDAIRVRDRHARLSDDWIGVAPRKGTWFAFAVNLSLYLEPQVAEARRLADLYQDTLRHHEAEFQMVTENLPGYEPLVWDWHRQLPTPPKLDTSLKDLQRSRPDQRWIVVIVDTRLKLATQFNRIEKQLQKSQTFRQRASRKDANDFWLKRHVVLAELQALNIDGLRSAPDIERALFDVDSPQWRRFWAAQLGAVPSNVPRLEKSQLDKVKDSLPEARAMVEMDYGFLVGREPADLHRRGA